MEPNEFEGFLFEDALDCERAAREKEKIDKIKETVSYNDFEGLKLLYDRLIEKKYFKTAVGLKFMSELRVYLSEQYPDEELLPVPFPRLYKKEANGFVTKTRYEAVKKERDRLSSQRSVYGIVIAALAVVIVGMIYITLTNDNSGLLNAEEKVLDKYAYWEEELTQRESELDEREMLLKEREEALEKNQN